MINEAHHVPQHRVFTTRLLAALYRQGYRWFAAETLTAKDTDLNRRGYPTRQTGFYTSEPLYADLVRTALRLGYHVVAYEAEGKGDMKPGMSQADMRRAQDERERGQAQNLIARVFRQDRNAKLLVHVGYGHASRRKMEHAGFRLMGRHFKELSGINALSVDQTAMSEAGTAEEENSLYREYAETLTGPVVFMRGRQPDDCFVEGGAKSGYDVQVFHPRSHYAQGRPSWMAFDTGRIPVRLPDAALQAAREQKFVLARVYVPHEWETEAWRAIPIDQIVLEKNKSLPVLMLSPGAYRLQLRTSEGKTLYDSPLTVAPNPAIAGAQNPLLAEELNRMAAADQTIRNKWIQNPGDKTVLAEMGRVEVADTVRMKEIIAQYGWPGRTLVGREAASNAWLLVQHADQDHAFQKQCLALMFKSLKHNDVQKQDYALLMDRVLLADGKKQRYGTQFTWTADGKMTMRPTENEKHLEQRRKSMGLPPLTEYIQLLRETYLAAKPTLKPESSEKTAPAPSNKPSKNDSPY